MDLGARATGIGTLADPTRRTLYGYVCSQAAPVGREQAATALEIAQHNVNFHFDKLVDEGLLEVEYRRLSGKAGPGAGRPSKLYRRADREFAVSLPPRHYDLIGDILAAGVARAQGGEALEDALHGAARAEGLALGEAAPRSGDEATLPGLAAVLGSQGYEPRLDEGVLELANCLFDALAQKHRSLVCSLNLDYVHGVADGMGCCEADPRLEPDEQRCCVVVHRAKGANTDHPRQ